MMNSLQRCMTVLHNGIPDRVPVCLQNFMHAANLGGYTISEYCQDGTKMANAHISAWERFGHDMIDLENGVTALAQAVGCQVEYVEDAAPRVVAPAINSIEEVDRLKPIDPKQDATLPEMLKATRLIADELGDRVCLLSEADQGPFSLAAHIIGPVEFLTLLLQPEMEPQIRRLLEYTTDQVLRYSRALIEAGAYLTMMGESISGPDVCSPKVYRGYAWPYQKRLVDTLQAEGKEIGMHICGNATRIIEQMVNTGSIFLQVDYKINHDMCKRAATGKTTLIGTVNPSEIMALGTAEQVMETARSDIEHLGGGGGFILSSGCTLPSITPDDNIIALIEAAKAYGQYG
jgi:uroporphyrinogen decarboxylase